MEHHFRCPAPTVASVQLAAKPSTRLRREPAPATPSPPRLTFERSGSEAARGCSSVRRARYAGEARQAPIRFAAGLARTQNGGAAARLRSGARTRSGVSPCPSAALILARVTRAAGSSVAFANLRPIHKKRPTFRGGFVADARFSTCGKRTRAKITQRRAVDGLGGRLERRKDGDGLGGLMGGRSRGDGMTPAGSGSRARRRELPELDWPALREHARATSW